MRASKKTFLVGCVSWLVLDPAVGQAVQNDAPPASQVSQSASEEPPHSTAQSREQRRADRRRAKASKKAHRQAAQNDQAAAGATGPYGADIVVTGLRKSVQDSIQKKKNSREIVDSVTAEDAGKLPDNNVIEAMARITGVDITRAQGRGDGFTIRGLAGVQTTINGRTVESADSRTIDLSSLAPDLIKSIDVYKTRGANQPEGGIGGSVNVELRRPLDLKKGLTVAGSFNESFGSQGKTRSPDGSLLVGDRFDTSLGEMGFLLTGAYYKTNFLEPSSTTESPDLVGAPGSTLRNSLPADSRDTVLAPYRGFYGLNYGSRKSPTINGSYQWKPTEHLSFVLEGTWRHDNGITYTPSMYVFTRQDYYTVQNPTIVDNLLTKYDIVNLPQPGGTVTNSGRIDAYDSAGGTKNVATDYNTNFEVHWSADGVRLDSSAQFNKSDSTYIARNYEGGFSSINRVGVDFESPNNPAGGPVYNFYGADITDPSQQYVHTFSDNYGRNSNKNWVGQQDLSLDIHRFPLLNNIQIGWRYSTTSTSFHSSYRYAGFNDPTRAFGLSAVPGVGTRTFTPPIQGASPLTFATLDPEALFSNWYPVITNFIIARNPDARDGPGRVNSLADQWAAENASDNDAVYAGTTKENIFATYTNFNYAFKAHFPIDGTLGIRYVNTAQRVTGINIAGGQVVTDPSTKKPVLDADGNQQYLPDVLTNQRGRANGVDLLPSLFGNVHWTNNLLLRLSWTRNVQRPTPDQLRDYRNINYSDPGATVYASNPDLKPTRTTDFNAALEWYFAKNGLVSVTFFNKDQTGFVYETRQLEPVPELGGALRYVQKLRNAGPGQTRGVEAQATGFFSFLPGLLHNLGATANLTWIPTAIVKLPVERDDQPTVYDLVPERSPYTSKFTYNLIGYYESGKVSVRVTYNWRSKYKTDANAVTPYWVQDSQPTSRLDASINYTPFKFLTFVLEGQNLTRNVERFYYDYYPDLKAASNQMGRTIKVGARFRF